ncbi:MAG: ATP-binding protein [Bacteroidetes bacterium]|nr:ATP-binding protein [Bacteroidota bacterium]
MLLDLDFLCQRTNVVIIGNRSRQDAAAQFFRRQAYQVNHRLLFTNAMDMLNQLHTSQADHSVIRKLRLYTEPSLLVCGETRVGDS